MVTIEHDSKRIESLLAVSLVVLFQPDPLRKESRRYQTIVRGWRWGEYIMMDRPRVDSRSLLMIREGQDCQVRYMIDGKACGFESRVLDFDTARNNPYMRLKWPERLEYTYFRRGERVKSNLSCLIRLDGHAVTDGHVVDLSQGGLAIESPVATERGKTIYVSLDLPGGQHVESLPLLVCNCREHGRKYFLGCSFQDDPHPGKDDVAFFVVTRLAADRGGEVVSGVSRALIIDHNTERAAGVAKSLARKGIECVTATTALDGFHRLKALRYGGVAIAHDQKDLPGVEITRVIRASGDFPTLPIAVYGDTGGGEQGVQQSGATLNIPASPSLGPEVATALAKLVIPHRP